MKQFRFSPFIPFLGAMISAAPLFVAQVSPCQSTAAPTPLVGSWSSGRLSQVPYWHGGITRTLTGNSAGGELTYVFDKAGGYTRYYHARIRFGTGESHVFSRMEGTVTFGKTTFTLKPTKGAFRFQYDWEKKPRERAMTKDEMAQPGLSFVYDLQKNDKGETVLRVGKTRDDLQTLTRDPA